MLSLFYTFHYSHAKPQKEPSLPRYTDDLVYEVHQDTGLEEQGQVQDDPRMSRDQQFAHLPEDLAMDGRMGDLVQLSAQLLVLEDHLAQDGTVDLLAGQQDFISEDLPNLFPARLTWFHNCAIRYRQLAEMVVNYGAQSGCAPLFELTLPSDFVGVDDWNALAFEHLADGALSRGNATSYRHNKHYLRQLN